MSAYGCNDSAFGPVSSCRHFDFTLKFENVVLTLIPSAVLILLIFLRVAALSANVAYRTSGLDYIGIARNALVSVNAVLALTSFALTVGDLAVVSALRHSYAAPAFALNFVASTLAIALSHVERKRSSGGGTVLPLWLFGTILLDACRARTFSFVPALHATLYPLFVTMTILKVLLLAAESTNGLKTLEPTSQESRASFVSRMTFFWLVPTVFQGFQAPLTTKILGRLPRDFQSEEIHKHYAESSSGMGIGGSDTLAPTYQPHLLDDDLSGRHAIELDTAKVAIKDDEKLSSSFYGTVPRKTYPTSDFTKGLIATCARAYAFPCLAPIVPMLLLTAANLTLPFLVSNTIAFAQSYSAADDTGAQPAAYGWGLVGATALVYLVIAIATGQFYWAVSKNEVKLRGAFVSAIYEKSQRLSLEAASHVGGGAAANLMSVDVERFISTIQAFHIIWSGLLTVGVGSFLLYRQMGLVFLSPLLTTILSLFAAPLMSWGLGDKQAAWSAETDKRVNLTGSIMANAKAIKFSAYENVLIKKMLEARDKEIAKAKRFYKQLNVIIAQTNVMTEVLIITTFSVLAYLSPERFNINVTFTSLTLISIIQTPLKDMGQDYGAVVAGLASLRRIDAFLKNDQRFEPTDATELMAEVDSDVCARMTRASYAWGEEPALRDVSLQIRRGQLSIICGRIASGKSTLLQSLLGETQLVGGEQQLGLLREPVAYVAQDVWLQEGVSIRRNIIFSSEWDSEKYQTAVLATGLDVDIAALLHGDETHAKSLSGGQRQRVALARAIYSDAKAYVLDDVISALDAETAAHVWRSLMGEHGLLKGKTVILVTNAMHLLHHADHIIRLEDGRVAEQGTFAELSVKGKDAVSRASLDTDRGGPTGKVGNSEAPAEAADSQPTESDDVSSGSVGWDVYKRWFRAGGPHWFVLTLLFLALRSGCQTGVQYVLQDWAAANEDSLDQRQRTKYLVPIVGLTVVVALSLVAALYILLLPIACNSGRRLHRAAAVGVMSTSLAFFAETSLGKIIGRYSQDLMIIDWELPGSLINYMSSSVDLVRSVIVLAIPAPYLLLIIAVIAVAYVSLQRLYIPASRQLRRLELEYKSPLYTTFGETTSVSGLATIRALKAREYFFGRNLAMLDDSQKPFYYLWATRRWLQTVLNLMAMVVNVGLVAIVVLLRHSSAAGLLGVSLVQATKISAQMNQAFISATELEIGSVAIERVHQFAQLKPEGSDEGKQGREMPRLLEPSEVKGELELRNVSVSYRSDLPPALRDVSFKLEAGQRLGVAGRSGSGKSTLLLALFRLVEASQGQILVDGKDTTGIDAQSLRNAMTIIPQVPLILAASVRDNLDPEGICEDKDIWDALQKTELSDYVLSLPSQLETILTGETITLSMGQRQVFSLARALLRRRSILVLDECSSSMDVDTDRKMQELLRTYFADCTVVTIAHRISGIIDADKLLVLGGGQMVEYGSPQELMAKRNGVFRALASEQGL